MDNIILNIKQSFYILYQNRRLIYPSLFILLLVIHFSFYSIINISQLFFSESSTSKNSQSHLLRFLNQISSDDLDGLDQFIQSLVVFVNNDVDAETFKQLMALGAVKVKSENASLPADVKLLVNELNHSNTKVVYDRIYNNMLTIIGVPTSKKTTSGGDTGQAVQLSEGWEMANDRAKQDEEAFKATATEELKLILRICEKAPASGINNLKVKDIDIKFTRHKLDNLLVKSQAFLNMIKGGMALDCALIISGLCSDPNEVYLKSLEFYGGLEKWIEYFTDGKATESNENNNNGKEE